MTIEDFNSIDRQSQMDILNRCKSIVAEITRFGLHNVLWSINDFYVEVVADNYGITDINAFDVDNFRMNPFLETIDINSLVR